MCEEQNLQHPACDNLGGSKSVCSPMRCAGIAPLCEGWFVILKGGFWRVRAAVLHGAVIFAVVKAAKRGKDTAPLFV